MISFFSRHPSRDFSAGFFVLLLHGEERWDDSYASAALAGLGCEYCLSDVLENTWIFLFDTEIVSFLLLSTDPDM